ncbi:MAG: SUMF1/EgtB/PvdO family nonheme iron enzyme [Verrucomicrobiales bacterium]
MPGSKKDRERWRELNTVICKVYAPNPRKRFRSAAEFAEALRAVRGGIKPKPLLAPLLRLPALSAMAAAIIVLARSPSEGTAAAAAANALAAEIGKVEAAANSEPDDPRGSLRIESKPSGVDVVIGGMTLDVTPCLVGDLLPGDVTLLFRKTGYRDAEQTVEVEAGKETPMMVTLERWRQPIPGRYWENSLGMKFRPEDRHHIAIEPVEYDGKFESYINAMTDPFFVGGFLDHRDANGNLLSLAAVPKEDADQFCEWLTERDRTEGYISPDHFYTWEKVDGLPGQESLDSGEENPLVIFRACLKKREYGNVWITSVPDGAEVWFKGESVGMTPLDLPKVLVGPADFEVRKSGYRTAKVSGEVQAGKELPFDVTLEPSGEVIFGETWDSNSLGVPYVPVRDIMVAAYETRVSDMAAFAAESKREIPPPPFEQGGDHPAVGVTRSEAIAFCDWLTQKERAAGLIPADVAYRLPSDLEWSALVNLPPERPGAPADRQILIKNAYPWGRGLWPPPGGSGNFFDATAAATLKQPAERSLGQYGYDDGHAFTSPVGRSQPNAFGIHDLGGNAWEWVSDDFGGANKKFQTFGVLRGASHASWEQETLLSSFRNAADPEARTDGGQFGFRCVLAKVAPTPAENPADAASEGGGEVSEKATP